VRLLASLALLVCLVVLPAEAASPVPRVNAGTGISIVLPEGWRVARTSVTKCSDPAQRLVATTVRGRLHAAYRIPPRSGLVLLMEATSGRFPARPARFVLPRRLGNLGGCCEIPRGPGAELVFRDRGRKFYAFVYVGDRASPRVRASLVRLLDSLRVAVRR
jgi:hypothetical protein